jgi:DNA (cytosine-5)-methyltransferase 1
MKIASESQHELRFVDLCAGLGGFHLGLERMVERLIAADVVPPKLTCVAAAELEADLRACYVRNFPDVATSYADHFSPNEELGAPGYAAMPSFDSNGRLERIHGDLTFFLDDEAAGLRKRPSGLAILPAHDLLCAGFPCQPFSKSGKQSGFDDTRGTVFHVIATILEHARPAFVLLENVGNFERHDGGRTWSRVKAILEGLEYDVVATEHITSKTGSSGLLSPHHLGYPQHRERFFVLAQRRRAKPSDTPFICRLLDTPLSQRDPFRAIPRGRVSEAHTNRFRDAVSAQQLRTIISTPKRAGELAILRASQVSPDRVRCVSHWQSLLDVLREEDERSSGTKWQNSMPSFPIWGYELDPWRWYPVTSNPRDAARNGPALRSARTELLADFERKVGAERFAVMAPRGAHSWLTERMTEAWLERWVNDWPGYAGKRDSWPAWKLRAINQNREWALRLWSELHDPGWFRRWLDNLFTDVPAPSNQKLEWNCKGEPLQLWEHILQFRPSGLRVKRLIQVPALIAMTTTQVPVVPRLDGDESLVGASRESRGRHLVPSEALQLQGFPPDWDVPGRRERVFTCLGNAVHAGLVGQIFASWWFGVVPSVATLESVPVRGGAEPATM